MELKLEVMTGQGKKHNVIYKNNKQSFLDLVAYGQEVGFVIDTEDYYIMVKNIVGFKILEEKQDV